ncbi:Non-capsid protein NS-1 [Amphibalanus amphitrite]|uniref:Non-capsid protein NS-1 n=1 Tax=Amphibalanus amphitrite TaxID=1232801 RepID=A0A6A4X775_AMPAM|nr:Non-capsid protein NS-1 [Amphibalanus amphitrite]KAF0314208.1 Non-capsid protein NS-1 [Amphibalanus amphitrite]
MDGPDLRGISDDEVVEGMAGQGVTHARRIRRKQLANLPIIVRLQDQEDAVDGDHEAQPLWRGHCNPNDEDASTSASETNRNQRTEQRGRKRQYDEASYIQELVRKYNSTSSSHLINHLTEDEFTTLYNLTPNFRDRVKTVITFENAQRIKRRKAMKFWEVFESELGEFDLDSHTSEGYEWLQELFEANNIEIAEFLAWAEVIGDQKLQKTNTLLLYGPTTTGKTLIMSSLLQLHQPTSLSAMNNASPFYLAQLLNANIAAMEELTISEVNKDDFKKLLGIESMHISVKYETAPELLGRVPVFASTNNVLGGFLPATDRCAIQSRTKTFNLHREIKSTGDRRNIENPLRNPPERITPATWWEAYNRNLGLTDVHFKHITGWPSKGNKYRQTGLELGDGRLPGPEDGFVQLPPELFMDADVTAVIDWVFDGLADHHDDHQWMASRAVLAPRNTRVDAINATVTALFLGEELGDGRLPGPEDGFVQLPPELFMDADVTAVIDWVFDGLADHHDDHQWMASRAVLAPRNTQVDAINAAVTALFPGEEVHLLNADSLEEEAEDELPVPVEYPNTIGAPGLPAHDLALKPGMPLVLLRNLAANDGLCNGASRSTGWQAG